MKKKYVEPTITVVKVHIENLMLEVSGEISGGSGDSRQSNNNWEDE